MNYIPWLFTQFKHIKIFDEQNGKKNLDHNPIKFEGLGPRKFLKKIKKKWSILQTIDSIVQKEFQKKIFLNFQINYLQKTIEKKNSENVKKNLKKS